MKSHSNQSKNSLVWLSKWRKKIGVKQLLINQSPLWLKRLKLNCVPVWIFRDLSHYKIRRQKLYLREKFWNFNWIRREPLIIDLGLMKVPTCFVLLPVAIWQWQGWHRRPQKEIKYINVADLWLQEANLYLYKSSVWNWAAVLGNLLGQNWTL